MQRLVLTFVEAALGRRVGERHASRAAILQFAGDADAALRGVDAHLVAAGEGRVRGPDAPAAARAAGFEAGLRVLAVAVRDEGAFLRVVHADGQVAETGVLGGVLGARHEFIFEAEGARAEGFAPAGHGRRAIGEDHDSGGLGLGSEDRGRLGETEADHLRLAGFELRAELAEEGRGAVLPRMFLEGHAARLGQGDPAGAVGQDIHAHGLFAEQAGGETDGGGEGGGHLRNKKTPAPRRRGR